MKPLYKRMLKGMQKKETSSGVSDPWHLYILKCADATFYTGVTKDITRRLGEHNAKKGARYTRTRTPVRLVYQESCASRSAALTRECAVKALSRAQKEKLLPKKRLQSKISSLRFRARVEL